MHRAWLGVLLMLAACEPAEEYAPFEKIDLAGGWELTTEHGAFGEVRFVIDETWLLAYPAAAAEDDGPVMGWAVDEHVESAGDGACDWACALREDGRVRWWERSRVDVDWSTTHLFVDGPEPYVPLALDPIDRIDPIATGERSAGALHSFEVPARFGVLFGETSMRFFFRRRE
ncbi:MAG: hypothetical protein M5U28_09600 [Sandaracinaceae bacterium]|nr:hypothetical protein [Sandaracinaceae bacterium]